MDKQGFWRFLKKSEKKEHVVEGLINQVHTFEIYLASSQQIEVEAASEQDIQNYAKTLTPREIKGGR